jgi:hypothetical protein
MGGAKMGGANLRVSRRLWAEGVRSSELGALCKKMKNSRLGRSLAPPGLKKWWGEPACEPKVVGGGGAEF